MKNNDHQREGILTFVCPLCKQPLHEFEDSIECSACLSRYPKVDGFPRFTEEYEEVSPIASVPPNEIAMGKRSAREFLAPLLSELFPHSYPSKTHVLDVGCGTGVIVDAMCVEHGYDCWGIDLGYRRLHWKQLITKDTLALANGTSLPFEDESFHLTYSFGVIEHVGATGPGMLELKNDYLSTRQKFVRELVRVTKNGGYILLTCPSRTFPIDFFHSTNRFGMRFHSPAERLLLSYKDIKDLLEARNVVQVNTLPLQQYFGFSWTKRGAHQGIRKLLLGPGKLYLRAISAHHLLRSSPLAPFLLILAKRQKA